jgi:4'-phosphopantetheinyl transferase
MDVFIIEIVDADNVHMELLKSFQKKEISNPKRWNAHCLSYLMLDRILRDFYKIENREIQFIDNKPVLASGEIQFSISHSGDFIALAFSNLPCGVDIEKIKDRPFEKIAQKMNFNSTNLTEFYKEWTKYEASGKCIGFNSSKIDLDKLNTQNYIFGDYALGVVSTNSQEQIEIYAQSGQIIPQ